MFVQVFCTVLKTPNELFGQPNTTKKREGNYTEKDSGQLCMVRGIMLRLEAGGEGGARRTTLWVWGMSQEITSFPNYFWGRAERALVGSMLTKEIIILTPLPFLTLHTNNHNPNTHTQWPCGKESAYQYRRCGFNPWVGKIPWRTKWQPTPVFLPGASHGQRSLVGYSPGGCKESDPTEETKQQTNKQC